MNRTFTQPTVRLSDLEKRVSRLEKATAIEADPASTAETPAGHSPEALLREYRSLKGAAKTAFWRTHKKAIISAARQSGAVRP